MTKPVNISVLIDSERTLDEAFKNPGLRIKAKSAKRPTLEQAIKATVSEVEDMVIQHITDELKPRLEEAYETHVLINGEHGDSEDSESWEEQVDEIVEEEIGQYTPVLSQDWLGKHTIATSLHEDEGIQKFCASLGREYFKQLTHDRETGKQKSAAHILSNAGITQDMIQARLDKHNNPTEKELKAMTDQNNEELEAVLTKIAAHVGPDFDIMSVNGDLDLASDDDDILASGAAPRLGIEAEDCEVLQSERVINGPESIEMMIDRITAIASGKKPKAAKAKGGKKPAKSSAGEEPGAVEETVVAPPAPPKPKAKAKAAEADTTTVISSEVLVVLKECGGKDVEMAEALGVSRATYNNYVNGKSVLEPTEEQAGYLRAQVVDKLNALHQALFQLDGGDTPPDEVY